MKFNTKKLTIGLLSTLLATLILPAKINVYGADTTPPPSIIGTMAVTLDYETGEIIYAKNIDDKAYPASTTKMLTALLLAENKDKTDKLIYPESAKLQPEYSLYKNYNVLNVNDTMSADDVMKSLIDKDTSDSTYKMKK